MLTATHVPKDQSNRRKYLQDYAAWEIHPVMRLDSAHEGWQRVEAIQTRWRRAFGPTRYYAFVFTADGNDLAELLVRNGLARIYGIRTPRPDGRDSRTYLASLKDLEQQAKLAGLGAWRH